MVSQNEDCLNLKQGDIVSIIVPTRISTAHSRFVHDRKIGMIIELPKPKKWSSGPVAKILVDGSIDYVPEHRIRRIASES